MKGAYMTESKIIMNQEEAAAYLGTTVGSLNALRHTGKLKLPYFRWGYRVRYIKADLDAWIEAQRVNGVDNGASV
jgi:excisionase family DNA binding protein